MDLTSPTVGVGGEVVSKLQGGSRMFSELSVLNPPRFELGPFLPEIRAKKGRQWLLRCRTNRSLELV